MKRKPNILGVFLVAAIMFLSPALAETSLQDLLDEACAISSVSAVCEISDLVKELGDNVEQFVEGGKGELRKRLSGGLVDIFDELKGDIGSSIELPDEISERLKEIVDLPDQYKDDYESAWSKIDEIKKSLTDDLVRQLRELMSKGDIEDVTVDVGGEEVNFDGLLRKVGETPEPCNELLSMSPLDDEYDTVRRACEDARTQNREAIREYLDSASDVVQEQLRLSQDAANRASDLREQSSQIDGVAILANAQASAERMATNYSLINAAKEASSKARELTDNAQNASSTRAAVQVLAEGMGQALESNVASLAAVQMSLAELAQQQVYTNQQINRVASDTVRKVASERNDELEDVMADASYYLAISESILEQGRSLNQGAEELFDTSCAQKSRWWEEGCE